MNNRKGFTLVEILAAITILGILTSIAIVSVTKIIEQGKEKHYVTAEKNLVQAGQTYAQQNRAVLPKAIGQKTRINLEQLQTKKYIQEIKDYNDNTCDATKSYVEIYKYSQSDYSYQAYLECPKYNSQEHINENTPEISASIAVNYSQNITTAPVTLTGNGQIMSYSYIVYRGDREVKNTGSVSVSGNQQNMSFTIPLTEYTPGQLKVVITVTNQYGNTKTKTLSKQLNDNDGPECVIQIEDQETSPKTWVNTSRTITIGCDDGEGVGCKETSYSQTFTDTTKIGTISIEDHAGNKTRCQVSVYVDKEKPACTNSGDSTTWTNLDRSISYGCSDSDSGCHPDYSGGTLIQSTTAQTKSIAAYTIKDNAGNETLCAGRVADVYVDKTPPTCTIKGQNTRWKNTNHTINPSCKDTQSGCDVEYSGSYITQTETAQTITVPEYIIKDNVGNETVCSESQANVYVDKIQPYIVSVSLDNLELRQWYPNGDVMEGGYIKSKSCTSPTECTAVACLKNKKGTFNLEGFSATFEDDHSGFYTWQYWGKEIYDKNGNSTEGAGCLKTKGHNPCTYKWMYRYRDIAGNYEIYTIDYKVGYIGQNDGLGC